MRVLFFGDMAATGFGTVTMDLGRELLALGHDLRFVSQNEWDDLPEPFKSRTLRITADMTDPVLAENKGGVDGLGVNSTSLMSTGVAGLMDGRLWADGWVPECNVILGDYGNARLAIMRDDVTRAAFAEVPTFHYVPIEGVGLPPSLSELWSLVRPVAMSNFGAEQIEKVTGQKPPMVYHGIDTEQFRPFSPERPFYAKDKMLIVGGKEKLRSKADAKRAMGCDPRARIILRTDRNMIRKRYPSWLRAMAPVVLKRPDVYLVIHAFKRDLGGDFDDWLSWWPPALRSHVVITDARTSRDVLTTLYNAADLYVSCSAEGFGLTIAEALACGTPAVGLDYSSVPEVIGPGGVLSPATGLLDNEYGYFWAAADEQALSQVTGDLIDDEAARKVLARQGVEHVRKSFSWAKAAIQFSALFRDAVPTEVAA
jgi:glycosyltransferase involved in cell wall biosynthesis